MGSNVLYLAQGIGDMGINTFPQSDGATEGQYVWLYANYSPFLKRATKVKEQL